MKTCRICLVPKDITSFYAHPKTRDRHQAECKRCTMARRAQWAVDNPAKAKAAHCKANEAYRRRLRVKAIDFLGGKCARCGQDDRRVLEIDHIDGGGTREVKKIGNHGVHLRITRGEPGYQVLCGNCHSIKTWHE